MNNDIEELSPGYFQRQINQYLSEEFYHNLQTDEKDGQVFYSDLKINQDPTVSFQIDPRYLDKYDLTDDAIKHFFIDNYCDIIIEKIIQYIFNEPAGSKHLPESVVEDIKNSLLEIEI